MSKVAFWQGNLAVAMAALDAGCRFYGGYPITPSSEIAEVMAEELPKKGGKFIQMEDEIAGIAASIGGSVAGKKSMTATSGPGFSLKQELIGYACMGEIPLVIVNVQRGGPSTGLPTKIGQADMMQARWGTHGDHPTIALCPSSVQECYELTVDAFNMAEKYRNPVMLMSDEILGHMREKIVIPDISELKLFDRKKPTVPPAEFKAYQADSDGVPPMAAFGDGYRWHITGLTHNEWGFPTNNADEINKKIRRMMGKVDNARDQIVRFDAQYTRDADVVVLAYGIVARTALRAVRQARDKGLKVGFFRPITAWPFPDREIEEIASRVKTIIVPELNMGQMVLEVERAVHGKAAVDSLILVNGEMFKPDDIVKRIEEVK